MSTKSGDHKKNNLTNNMNLLSNLMTISYSIAGPVIGFIVLGIISDIILKSTPYLMLIGGIVGFIVSVSNALKTLNKMQENK